MRAITPGAYYVNRRGLDSHPLGVLEHRLGERGNVAAPLAQRATKEVAWRTADMGWIESVRFGEVMRKVAAATGDAAEGVRAWAEKRKPEWKGR